MCLGSEAEAPWRSTYVDRQGALESDSALIPILPLASSLTLAEFIHPFCACFPYLWNEENENYHGEFCCSIKFSFIVYKFYLYIICPA